MFFYLVTLINYSKNKFNVFFIWSPSLPILKIGSMFFYLVALITYSKNKFNVFLFSRPYYLFQK